MSVSLGESVPAKRKFLRTTDLLKISVNKLCKDFGYTFFGKSFTVFLQPERIGTTWKLCLYVNGNRLNHPSWLISTEPIRGRVRRGGRIGYPASLIVCNETKQRRRFLYLDAKNTRIGTRTELGIRFPSKCMSRKQRGEHKQLLAIRRAKRTK